MNRWLATALLLGLTACSVAGKRPDAAKVTASGRPPREIYAHAEKMIRVGAFEKAQADYQELRNFHRDDPLSLLAQLALADIHFRKGEFEEARYAYQEFAQYHPRHEAMDYVTWRTGLCIWKRAARLVGRDQTPTVSAVRAWTGGGSITAGFDWDAFQTRYPDSEYVPEVERLIDRARDRLAGQEMAIAKFYARREAWAAVQGRTEGLVRLYGGARQEERALAMLSRSLHETGRPEEARIVRDKLAEAWPDSSLLAGVDRALAAPPGLPPEDEIFVRPYRMPGLGEAQQGR